MSQVYVVNFTAREGDHFFLEQFGMKSKLRRIQPNYETFNYWLKPNTYRMMQDIQDNKCIQDDALKTSV